MMSFEMLNQMLGSLDQKKAVKFLLQNILRIDLDNPFENVEKVLCIQPHPDDCELAVGGILAKLFLEGKEIVYLTLTDGTMGTRDPMISPQELAGIRKKEQEKAAKVIGVKKLIWFDYKDTELPYSPEVRNRIISVIRKEKPDIVFAPDPWLPYEAHPDHRNAGFLALEAVFFAPFPYINKGDLEKGLTPYEVPLVALYYTARPNYIEDVTDVFDVKLRALKEHRSQFEKNWQQWELFIRIVGMFYGKKIGAMYGEGIKVLPRLLLHVTPFAEVV
ncbi:PIG-L deacetylase family protein [Thermococcus barophilus]|nr:PIG-L deacetylase family protein [Thermococcus barophilus]